MGTTTFGREGENLAKVYLEKKGYKFLDRNFKRIHGEVDLIMMDGDVIVFVEVKSRHNRKYGDPIEAVNKYKQMITGRKTKILFRQSVMELTARQL